MKIVDGYYLVEVSVNRDRAVELINWLNDSEHRLDRMEGQENMLDYSSILSGMHEADERATYHIQINFKNEETALLTQMKFA